MGEVREYPHGTFCWIDLGTTDADGARAFYGELFGWEGVDLPAGDRAYTVFRLDGHDVAGMHRHPAGDASGWDSAVAVDDLDAATARARELGATVLHEPGGVPGVARTSRIADPGGAVLGLSERRGHAGATLVNEVGTWNWNELTSPAIEAAGEFYGALFGWTANAIPGPMPRTSFGLGELLVGGGHAPTPQEGESARWTVSFMVADADESVALVERLGGRLLFGPLEVPAGKFAVVADPAGASFTVTAAPGGAFRGVDGS